MTPIKTLSDGTAAFTLTSSQDTGSIEIKATCDGATGNKSITVGPPESANGGINVTPSDLVADGKQTATVVLGLRFRGAERVPGHRIAWRISKVQDDEGKTISDETLWPAYGELSAVDEATNGVGNAVAIFTVGTQSGTVTIQAVDLSVRTSNSGAEHPTFTKSVFVDTKTSSANHISVSSAPQAILAGGVPARFATAVITATVTNKAGRPVVGAVVNFTSRYDDGTPAGSIKSSQPTDAAGKAIVSLTSGTKLGTATIKATTSDATGVTEDICTVKFEPPKVALDHGAWIDDGNGQMHQLVTVTVTYQGQPVPDFAVNLSLQVCSDQFGCGVASPDYAQSVHLDAATGVTNSQGVFSTMLRWTPPTSTTTQAGDVSVSILVNSRLTADEPK